MRAGCSTGSSAGERPPAPLACAQALPTMVFFKDGEPIDRIQGVVQALDLHVRLSKLL
jgi:hypothetical protein